MPIISVKNSRLSCGLGVSSSTGPRWAMSGGFSSLIVVPPRRRAGRQGRMTWRRPGACSRLMRSFSSRASDASRTSVTRSCGTTATPSASSTTTSPGLIVAPPTVTGTLICAGGLLERALDAHPAGPDRQAHLGELLDVADRRVDQDRGGAGDLRLRGEQVTDQRHRPRLAASSARSPRRAAPRPSPRAPSGCRPGAQSTVRAGPAARLPGTAWYRSAST